MTRHAKLARAKRNAAVLAVFPQRPRRPQREHLFLRRRHVAEQHPALRLVLLGGFDDRDGHGARIDLIVLYHRIGEVLDERALLLDRAASERVEHDFRHQTLLCWPRRMVKHFLTSWEPWGGGQRRRPSYWNCRDPAIIRRY